MAAPATALAVDPFLTSSRSTTLPANEFWNIYGQGYDLGGGLPPDRNNMSYGGNTAWNEWDALKLSWTNINGGRTAVAGFLRGSRVNGVTTEANGTLTSGARERGFVWSWAINERWPDTCSQADYPRCFAAHGTEGSFHFDQVPAYINGIHLLYVWTRDTAFLQEMLPRAEVVMDEYLLGVMGGSTGVAVIPGNANTGTSSGRPSTYLDQIRSGHKDTWVNASFYTALLSMGDLEEAAGNTSKASSYRTRAASFRAHFHDAFWTGTRYAGWRDVNGALHDAGYTHVNLMALTRGLASVSEADSIIEWLDGPVTATVGGVRVGSTSTYQNVFAPRTNTSPVPAADWDEWSNPSNISGPLPYGAGIGDGGTMLWLAYYDVMGRLRYRHADEAFARYQAMLTQMSRDTARLTYCFPEWVWCNGTGRYENDFHERHGEVATNGPFPESGLSVLPLLHGFMGVGANLQGLRVAPELPSSLVFASTSGVDYLGAQRTIRVSRGRFISNQETATSTTDVGSSVLTQTFLPAEAFNEVGVLVGTYGVDGVSFTLSLEKSGNGGFNWVPVATRRLTGVQDNTWVYMGVPSQAAGGFQYRLSVRDASSALAWWRDPGSTLFGSAASGGTLLTGDFAFRAVDAWQTPLVGESSTDVADSMTGSLGQVFTTTQPFDRVSMRIGTYVTTTSGFTATLYRDSGAGWKQLARQTFKNVVDNSDVMMSFASMKPGKYYLEISDQVGSITWWRNSTSNLGAGFWAATNAVQQSGNRTFYVYRGQYRIEVPEKGVDVTVSAGDSYTMTN
ncbi:hypothetical protein [Pyxidicoccus sp. MSG2]|uniref:hypothetical protein n=1 Tax=Pyxidicoccus sp. MSG2 TaxID=2996790 RepID=UPI002270B509|nr:hypothetical protein [Pyxidicoccus sp. MSG2]MCY1020828.1 hypothetical protein [Pyxidicoccus sp. MSG2]